nr:AAA family ATPase [Pelagibacterales bacterium]
MSEKVTKQSNFIQELCKYYMDFLKGGFKSTRFPKRYIRLTNEKNFKIGVDLSKYEKFNNHIKKLISKEGNFQNNLNIKKGEYSVKLNNTAQDLVKKLVKQISDKDIEKIINLAARTIKEFSVSHRNKPDEAYDQIIDIIKKDLITIIIKPVTDKMEPLIGSQSNFVYESLFTLAIGLSESILDPLVEEMPSIFNDGLADKKIKPKDQLSTLFNKKDISTNLLQYFENFDVKDLYYDLQEIVNARKNLDKKEIYLYLSELEIEKKRFPLFYTQINIQEYSSESKFQISFSNELFINKLAIQYAFDILKKDQKIVETFGEERKIYISDEEDFCDRLNKVINTLIPKLRLEGNIDLKNFEPQIAKSINFVLSNNCSICVFDKSDEALINDFEDILSKILSGENSEIVDLFKSIISDFLLNEPHVITEDLEDEWEGLGLSERLNYKSPIPLNSEQLKILRALKNEKCKYVVVEGPPGTGKSHTISAIAFEYILEGKSILILSDTREALDVVENKINNTLDKVRGETNIQNPILRLGKMGNTYSKILSRNSIENIRTFHRSQKNDINKVTKEINEISDIINDRVEVETEHYKYIDKEKFEEFFEIQKVIKKEDLVLNLKSLLENFKTQNPKGEFNLNSFIDSLYNIEDTEELIDSYIDFNNKEKNNFTNFIKYLNNFFFLQEFLNKVSNIDNKSLFFFNKVNSSNINSLDKILIQYKDDVSGIFGSFLKGGKIAALSEKIQSLMNIKKILNLKFDLEQILETRKAYQKLQNICDKFKIIKFDDICSLIKKCNSLTKIKSLCELSSKYIILFKQLSQDTENLKNLSIDSEDIESIFGNVISELDVNKKELLKKYYEMEEFFSKSFNVKERFDYTSLMKQLQSLYTSKMANELDGKLIKFYDSNRSNAVTLSKIIRAKQKFPKPQFDKLKGAFPCIISSVRDFAEYINLQKDLFDLIIVDEASQVSIAQAFPALIRAKKVLVLGDKKQFSNLQSYQAATLVNNSHLNNLRKVFKKNISAESDKLVRLEAFNVKTSILDFFQNI